MGVETKMVSENPRDANAMQIPRHRYYVSPQWRHDAPKGCTQFSRLFQLLFYFGLQLESHSEKRASYINKILQM